MLKFVVFEKSRLKRSFSFLLGAASLATVASACSAMPYAAKVGSSYISVSELNSELRAIGGNRAFVTKLTAQETVFGNSQTTFATQFVDQVLNRRIAVTLIDNANAKLGIKISKTGSDIARLTAEQSYGGQAAFDAFPKAYQAELVRDTANITALESYLTKTDISLTALAAYYKANLSKFTQICAAHIVLATNAQATLIYNQINAGASFTTLAKSKSLDSNTAPNGGYIGCGTYSNFASVFGPSFANELISGSPNIVLPPVPISQGYSVPMVVSKTVLPFSQSIPTVIGTKFGSKAAGAMNAFVSGLAQGQNVSINPAYGTFSISKASATVLPPVLPTA